MPQQIEVRDSGGKLLGYFIPADPDAVVPYAKLRKLFDRNELKKRKKRSRNDPGRTLDQIMDRLHRRGQGQ